MPDEIYNLAAQSHVAISFNMPEYTAQVDALGTKDSRSYKTFERKKLRFYQASSSELYGKVLKRLRMKIPLLDPEVLMQ